MTDTINIQGVYTVAIVKNFEAGIAWYETFMGRPADDLPFPGMAQWRNMGAAGLQLWQDDARAGHSIMTIVVPDLAKEKSRLSEAGMVLENEDSGVFGAVAQLFDPEGNQINLAEPPKNFVNR
jgi:predicted enzyme related to lactoylglutathione lyase